MDSEVIKHLTRGQSSSQDVLNIKKSPVLFLGRPWSYYETAFKLSNLPEKCRILNVGAGPSSATKELQELGHYVVSVDPAYKFGDDELRKLSKDSIAQFKSTIRYEELRNDESPKSQSLVQFVDACPEQLEIMIEHRKKFPEIYVDDQLPELSGIQEKFDLVLVSQLLFQYSFKQYLDEDMHLKSILRMLEIGKKVLVHPISFDHPKFGSGSFPILDKIIPRLEICKICPLLRLDSKLKDYDVNFGFLSISK
jgi:SAM-dependent methyltransferase